MSSSSKQWYSRLKSKPSQAEPIDFIRLSPLPRSQDEIELTPPKPGIFERPLHPSPYMTRWEELASDATNSDSSVAVSLVPDPSRPRHRRRRRSQHEARPVQERVSPYPSGYYVTWSWNILDHPRKARAYYKGTMNRARCPVEFDAPVVTPPVTTMTLRLDNGLGPNGVLERLSPIRVQAQDISVGVTLLDLFAAIYTFFDKPCSGAELQAMSRVSDWEHQLERAKHRLVRSTRHLSPEDGKRQLAVGLKRGHFISQGRSMFERIERALEAHHYSLFLTK